MCEEEEEKLKFVQQEITALHSRRTFDAFHCFVMEKDFRPYSIVRVAEVIMMRLDHAGISFSLFSSLLSYWSTNQYVLPEWITDQRASISDVLE